MPEPGAGATPAPSKASRFAAAAGNNFDVAASIGGVRGFVETVVPTLVFSIAYAFTSDLRQSVYASLISSALFGVARLIQRQSLSQVIGGVVGIGLGAFVASRTGDAADVFLPSLWKNSAFAIVYGISAIIRWPLLGLLLGPILGESWDWRNSPARLAAYQRVTWVWVGLFLVRLAIQTPLYLADEVAILGFVNILLGLPLFGLTLWITWLMLKKVPLAVLPDRPADAEQPFTPDQPRPDQPGHLHPEV